MTNKELLKTFKCPHCKSSIRPNMRMYNTTIDFEIELGEKNIWYDFPNVKSCEYLDFICFECNKVILNSTNETCFNDLIKYLKKRI